MYSAGIVGYEMLTGHPPFSGDNAIAVAYQHVHADVPPVESEAPGVPVGIAAAIDAATRRDPLSRPRDAADFLARLQDTRAELGLRLAPAPVPRSARPADPQPHPSLAGKPAHRGSRRHPAPPARRSAPGPAAGAGSGGRGSAAQHRPGGPAVAGRSRRDRADRAPRDRSAGRKRGTTPADRPADLTAARAQVAGDPARTDRLKRPLRGRRPNWRLRITLLVVLLLVVAAAAFGGWWLGGRWTSTPDVRGVAQEAAIALVRDAGLVPQLSAAPDDVVPGGKVASAQPAAGTRQLRGSTVSLVVSTGRPRVPQVAPGTTVDAATAAITAVGLRVDTDPDGRLRRHRPARQRGADRSRRRGSDGHRVGGHPDPFARRRAGGRAAVAGKQPEDARNALLVAGFTIGSSISQFDADEPAGTVIGTVPRGGSSAAHGSAVSLVMATSLTVPSLAGMTQDVRVRDADLAGVRADLGARRSTRTCRPGGGHHRADGRRPDRPGRPPGRA